MTRDELGTDALKWAKAFMKATELIHVDEEFMLGWFANAIMAGHDEAQRAYEMVNRHQHSMAMIGIEAKQFTEPEPVNINELKRLLVEVISDMLDTRDRAMSPDEKARQRNRLTRQIENAILNGDDS